MKFITLLAVFMQIESLQAFQSFFKIPSFQPIAKSNVVSKEAELLKAVSNTANGKDVTPPQQRAILNIVRELEVQNPPDEDILTNPSKNKDLDGVWFLQYTSPSEIKSDDGGDEPGDSEVNVWKAETAEDPKIETKQFEAKGSVSAAGLRVDVSNRVPRQIFDIENNLFFNEVDLDYGQVRVGGPFKISDRVPNRVIACFKEGSIDLNIGLKVNLSGVFSLINLVRGTDEGGWLETTYLSTEEGIRIGRGNKGSMFILTRDKDAVSP